jgi:hypothetical protein
VCLRLKFLRNNEALDVKKKGNEIKIFKTSKTRTSTTSQPTLLEEYYLLGCNAVSSQKTALFITTAVRTLNPNLLNPTFAHSSLKVSQLPYTEDVTADIVKYNFFRNNCLYLLGYLMMLYYLQRFFGLRTEEK